MKSLFTLFGQACLGDLGPLPLVLLLERGDGQVEAKLTQLLLQ